MNEALHSALSPQGFPATPIATLAWTLFAFGTVILLLVVVATWFAIRGNARLRKWLATERSILAFGLLLPAVTLTLLLGYGLWLTRAQLADGSGGVQIEVTGEQWWWRVVYGGSTPVASANEIRIPVGKPIDFTLRSADVIHSFWIPSLGGKIDMIPGRVTRLRLTATREGIYRGQCAEYCGGPHALMALDVIALPPEQYDVWLTAQTQTAASPVDDTPRRGQSLFIAAGCGACHTVRGTTAVGTIGPDLTHVGSRRSVGEATLPLNAANLKRFIHHGQSVKPGNRMPEFRVFTDGESDALVSYLLSLT